MNTKKNNVVKGIAVVLMLVVCVVLSGCTMERRTEDSAVFSKKSEMRFLYSSASDQTVAIGKTAIEALKDKGQGTNAHDSAIEKAKVNADVTTTKTTGPSDAGSAKKG